MTRKLRLIRPPGSGPIGLSIAVKPSELLFCSGQIPLDPATGQVIDGDIVAQTERVLANICNELEALLDARLPELISEYRELSCTLGRAVTVSPSGGEAFEATALSISDDGELMVRRANGLVEAINAADLSVRPR